MLVRPEIFNHPKFTLLQKRVGKSALYYLCRIWAYCGADQRGECLGALSPDNIESLADWEGEPGILFAALTERLSPTESPWLDIDKKMRVSAHNWDEVNAGLHQKWDASNIAKAKRRCIELGIPYDPSTARPPKARRATGRPPVGHRSAVQSDQIGGIGQEADGKERRKRYPDSVEEVIAHGAKMNPIVPEDRCRAFFAHFEGQAKEGPNGKFWVASSSNGGEMVVTNWQARLAGWRVDPDNKKTAPNPGAVNSRIIFLQRELKETAEAGDDATLQLRREMRQQLEVLLKKQKELTE